MKSQKKTVLCRDKDGNKEEIPVEKLSFRPSIYAIIIKEEKVLLVPQWDGYDFPGGGIDLGETLDEAFEREVWEETGLHVKRGELLASEDDFYMRGKDFPCHSILLYYTCKEISGEVSSKNFSEEEKGYAKKAEWISIANIPKLKIRFYNSVDSLNLIKKARDVYKANHF